MKKKILYLEDNGYLLRQTVRFLKDDGYEVIYCSRIDSAKREFQKYHKEIDCIITDLNMDDQWLGDYQEESYGGLLSGWVWLHRFVKTEERYWTLPCIVYSGYIPELNAYLSERNESYLLGKYNVSCIQKGGSDCNGYSALYRELGDIFHNKKGIEL